ncbi:MAG: ADP-forming succinate--CoA ligase subunit beta [Alphaproteobacteria bacterium]|jgi:succinyl-CoA synthetase beta subunit
MNIHEYQAKDVLKKFGVPVPGGQVSSSVNEAEKIAKNLISNGAKLLVVKAQIHAGGRGKAGGVKLAKTVEEVKNICKGLFGKHLVTYQTTSEGQEVRKILIAEAANILKEYYISLLVDRATSKVTFIVSKEGGVDIEEVAKHHPEKVLTVAIDPVEGIQAYHLRNIAYALGFEEKNLFTQISSIIKGLYKTFIGTDAAQIEINPLGLVEGEKLVAIDAKITFDDNSLFRHPEIVELRDVHEENPLETKANDIGISYVKMDGNIGCMVNGAGLAMATMDIIKLEGAEPANFLDVGGGANKEKVTEAFKIILSDSNVKGILVNIFGGIMKCDIIANGIIAAAKEVKLSIPLVVRLEGTNVDLGKEILAKSGLDIIPANDLGDAAKKIVKAVGKK